jgi:large subunit ribosomal protein L14e
MAIVEVGRLAVKIAGRDAGKECLIIDVLDKNNVLIDGNTRRRKCNIQHLEFLPKKADIKKNATHEEVLAALASLGIKVLPKAGPKEKKSESEKIEKAEKQEAKPKRLFKRKTSKEESKAE